MITSIKRQPYILYFKQKINCNKDLIVWGRSALMFDREVALLDSATIHNTNYSSNQMFNFVDTLSMTRIDMTFNWLQSCI